MFGKYFLISNIACLLCLVWFYFKTYIMQNIWFSAWKLTFVITVRLEIWCWRLFMATERTNCELVAKKKNRESLPSRRYWCKKREVLQLRQNEEIATLVTTTYNSYTYRMLDSLQTVSLSQNIQTLFCSKEARCIRLGREPSRGIENAILCERSRYNHFHFYRIAS